MSDSEPWVCTKCRRVGRANGAQQAQADHDALHPPCGYLILFAPPPPTGTP